MTVLPLTGSGHIRFVKELPSGYQIDTVIVGNGPTKVVFLHGLGGTPLLYLWLLQMLAVQLELTIYAPYLPNHGRSTDLSHFAHIDAALFEWAHELGLGKVLWIGHSIGAYFALAMSIWYPGVVSEVVALAPPVAAPLNRRPLKAEFLGPRLGYLGLEALAIGSFGRLWAWLTWRGLEFDAALLDLVLHPPRLLTMIDAFDGSPDLLPFLPRVPSTYVFGRHDLVVASPSDPLAGTTHVVDGAVHCFPFATWTKALASIVAIVASVIGAQLDTSTSPAAGALEALPA